MTLTIGSLFTGVGGLELGLERAGLGPVVWQVEIDPFCRRVLAKHWPDAARYEDVKTFASIRSGQGDRVLGASRGDQTISAEIICGGFPCVDISTAGKRAGIDGEQSSLWREFARIIRLVQPRYVVVENVAALLVRGMGDVLADLASCGYDAIWDCIPAQAVGAPHRRDRVFVVAWRVPDTECDGIRDESERRPGAAQAPDSRNPFAVALGKAGRSFSWPPGPNDLQAWRSVRAGTQPTICGVADGARDRAHRLRALGNSVVPQVAEVVGRVIQEMECKRP